MKTVDKTHSNDYQEELYNNIDNNIQSRILLNGNQEYVYKIYLANETAKTMYLANNPFTATLPVYSITFLQGFTHYCEKLITIFEKLLEQYTGGPVLNTLRTLYKNLLIIINSRSKYSDDFITQNKDIIFTYEMIIEFLIKATVQIKDEEELTGLVQQHVKTFSEDYIFPKSIGNTNHFATLPLGQIKTYCTPACYNVISSEYFIKLLASINNLKEKDNNVSLLPSRKTFMNINKIYLYINNFTTERKYRNTLLKDYNPDFKKYEEVDLFDDEIIILEPKIVPDENFMEILSNEPMKIGETFIPIINQHMIVKNYQRILTMVKEYKNDYNANIPQGKLDYWNNIAEKIINANNITDEEKYNRQIHMETISKNKYLLKLIINKCYNNKELYEQDNIEDCYAEIASYEAFLMSRLVDNDGGIDSYIIVVEAELIIKNLYKILTEEEVSTLIDDVRNIPETENYDELITFEQWIYYIDHVDEYKDMPVAWWKEIVG